MQVIKQNSIDKAILQSLSQSDTKLLGICLGMQLMLENSQELENCSGLNLVPGTVEPLIEKVKSNRLPHMGWNEAIFKAESPLTAGLNAQGEPFYFVHSYRVVQTDPALVWCETDYAGRFVSGVRRGRVLATQFHPEKSQVKGLQLYRNFLTLADR